MIKINAKDLIYFKEAFKTYCYEKDSILCYPGQISSIAFILLSGRAQLIKKEDIFEIKHNFMWGVGNLINRIPVNEKVKIYKDSEIICLDSFTIRNILKQNKTKDTDIFKLAVN